MGTAAKAGRAALAVWIAAAAPAAAVSYFVDTKASAGGLNSSSPADNKFETRSTPFELSSGSAFDKPAEAGTSSGQAFASSATGALKGHSLATAGSYATVCCTSATGNASTNAQVDDMFVLASSAHANGSIAKINAAILVDGLLDSATAGTFWSGSQWWRATVLIGSTSWEWGGQRQGNGTNGIFELGAPLGLKLIEADVVLGAPTRVLLRLETSATAQAGGFGVNSSRWETDLGNTLTWRGIRSMSVAGVAVDDFSALGSTGFDYRTGIVDPTPNPGAIPEPGSWAMLLVGFGVLGMAARRQRPAPRVLA